MQRRIEPLNKKDRDILIISLRTKKRLTVRSIRGLCDRWIKGRAGIQRAHAYLFRHTFATR
jgi:site-specific recombinase XerD